MLAHLKALPSVTVYRLITPLNRSRLTSIDSLRGVVMALMLLDHVREFFYLHLQVPDPMLIGTTPPDLFFTRLSSHFCAPIFVLLTGLGAWLYGNKPGRGRYETSAYLAKRGVLLIVLELTLVSFAWTFSFPPQMIYLQVIWVIGLAMLALALLLWLPVALQVVLALVIIFGHNTLDSIQFAVGDPGFIPWAILHDRSVIELSADLKARTSYPLLPWIGIILLGYRLGHLYETGVDARFRQRVLTLLGLGSLAGFVVLRLLNVYGDHPWSAGSNPIETLMSFLNITKYPPSLLFVLLTLGVGVLSLAQLERMKTWAPLARLGSVPMFFYITHLYVLHVLHVGFSIIFGATQGSRYGFSEVWQIWALAALVMLAIYWPCRWFSRVRQTSSARWLSYF